MSEESSWSWLWRWWVITRPAFWRGMKILAISMTISFFNTYEVLEETKNIACRNRWFWHVQGWRKKSSIDPRLGPKSGQHANITLCKSSGTWETYPAAPLLSKYVCSLVLNHIQAAWLHHRRRLEIFTRWF